MGAASQAPRQRRAPRDEDDFVGRRQEMAAGKGMSSRARLLTVTGPPGVGKTRLGLRLARQVAHRFADGTCLVELAPLTDANLLADTVVHALGVQDRSQRPLEALISYLADRRMLVLLDNCEHLGDACAKLVHALLTNAPRLRILATSRRTLGISGEQVLTVPPLALPDAVATSPKAVSTSEAAELFAARAAEVLPGFRIDAGNAATVAEICRRLEGIPLAIELAAVRLRTLSPQQLLQGLDERFASLSEPRPEMPVRHQTLQSTIDWSFHLCSPTEQRFWARSSVFAGSFDLDTAETVCSDEVLPAESVLDLVAALVDMSVLDHRREQGGAQYGFLDTIRHYGQDRLESLGETAALCRRVFSVRVTRRWSWAAVGASAEIPGDAGSGSASEGRSSLRATRIVSVPTGLFGRAARLRRWAITVEAGRRAGWVGRGSAARPGVRAPAGSPVPAPAARR